MNSKSSNNQFVTSNDIMELEEFHAMQARQLLGKLRKDESKNYFIEIDCAPNGNLNAFYYGDGLKSAKIIRSIAGSFLGKERASLERKIDAARNSKFETDFELGEEAGLWKRVTSNNHATMLNWEEPFCVKNEKGVTKIWHPDWRRIGHKNGFSTRGAIINFICEAPAYLQEFYLPLPVPNQTLIWRMHYRLIFFAKTNEKKLDFIGGLWISRPSFKIYQDKDSLVGLVSPLTTTVFL